MQVPEPASIRSAAVVDALLRAEAHQLLGVLVGLFLAYRAGLIVYRVYFHPLSKFPGPLLLAATSFPYRYRNHIQGSWVRDSKALHQKYGQIIRIGPTHLALDGSVAWPEVYAHRVGKAEYPKMTDFFFPGDHQSIIGACDRETHRRQRRQLGHAFSKAALDEQAPIIMHYIELLMDRLSQNAENTNPVDIVSWLNFTTFDIIGDLAFADSFHSLDNSNYHPWVRGIFEGIRGSSFRLFLASYTLLKPLQWLAPADEIKKARQNAEYAERKAKARMSLGAEPKDGRRDFMTYMLRDNREGQKGMTETEIYYNSSVLVTAGSETTATALSGLFFYLRQNPDAYEILVDEIISAFSSESDITMSSTSSLEFLHACIEEALRIYPPAAEVPPRVSPGEVLGGHFVPSGTQISVYQWATFHNSQNFLEPNSFRPQRWLPRGHSGYEARFEVDNKAVFKPFSFGSRDCLGKNLAYAEMRTIAARFLYRFDYDLLAGQENWHDSQRVYTVWEKGPLMLVLKPRMLHAI